MSPWSVIVGAYTVRVTVTDAMGRTASCMTTVTLVGRGLRVELTWSTAGDVDLHMLHRSAAAWFASPLDCYYANTRPTWDGPADASPRLDVDNVTANGPENIRMNAPPFASSYTIAVHHYANAAGRRATIQIFCGLSGITPIVTYVSPVLAGTQSGNCTGNNFWRVARVTMTAGSCVVLPLNTITTSNNACSGL